MRSQITQNKKGKVILLTVLFSLLIFTFLSYSVFAGNFKVGNPTMTHTPTTDTLKNPDGTYTTLFYSGIRNVYEDNKWKKVEDAISLKDKGFEVKYLEIDPDFKIEVIDFNYDFLSLKLDFEGNWEDYPEYCSKNINDEIKCKFKLEEKYKIWNESKEDYDEFEIEYEQEFEWEKGKTREKIELKYLSNPIGKKFKFGGNSTTIILQEADTENIGDTQVYIAFPNTNYGDSGGMFIGTFFGQRYYGMVEFSMLSVPRGKVMVNSSLHLRGINSVVDNIIQAYEYSYFNESYLTYNNYPANGSFINSANTTGKNWMDINVTSWVSDCYLDNKNNCSFFLHNPTGSNPQFATKEHATTSYRPYLSVTYKKALNITLNKPDDTSVQGPSILFNCSVASTEGNDLSNITLFIWNSTHDIVNQTTINVTGFSNESSVSVDFTYDDTFSWNCLAYDNESLYNFADSNFTVTTSLNSPAINLDYPTDNEYFKNGTNIYFNYTASDGNGLDTCQLWGNWSDGWHKNYTWVDPSSGVMNWTIINITGDAQYEWNVWCNDTLNNGDFRYDNFTFTLDTIFPNISLDSITPSAGSQTFSFTNTINDTNLDSCKYSIFNSTGGIDGTNENVSFTCNSETSATVTAFATYNLTIYAIDLAGNENSTTDSFTTSPSVGNGGGAPGEEVEKIPTIALKQITGDKIYNELERAIFYARINTFCSIKKTQQTLAIQDFSGVCSLRKSDMEKIEGELFLEGFQIPINDLILFYEKYKERELEQVYMTLDIIKTYDLFTSVLGITNPMRVNPPRLDRPFIIFGDGNFTIEYVFVVNKKVKECSILSGEGFQCEVINDNSVKMILNINDTDFLDEIFQGEMSITSDAEPENIEVRRISLFLRVYNLSYRIMGIPAVVVLIILGSLVLMFSIFFIVRGRISKKLKRGKS